MNEFQTKQSLIHSLLDKHQLDGLLLNRVSSFAWATCGGDPHINTADSHGVGALWITRDTRCLVTTNIEAPRFEHEEKLAAQGWDFCVRPWYGPGALADLTEGKTFGADEPYPGATNLAADLTHLRSSLLPEESERFRALGKLCASAMDAARRAVRLGMTEYEIAAQLAFETQQRGVEPIVNLIATDERIFNFRHPIPKDKRLEQYAMLVLCGRKWGLICSLTRFLYFGRLPDELRHKADACATLDATFIAATRPGKTLGQVFHRAIETYAEVGYPNEWQLHHQGGSAGYEPRETTATPDSTELVQLGQAYAWNPSITGVKSEDTILVGETGNEVITAIPNEGTTTIHVDGHEIMRPMILEVGN